MVLEPGLACRVRPGIHPSSLRSRHRDRILCVSSLLESRFVKGNGDEAEEAAALQA